jgi:hypothetical protein
MKDSQTVATIPPGLEGQPCGGQVYMYLPNRKGDIQRITQQRPTNPPKPVTFCQVNIYMINIHTCSATKKKIIFQTESDQCNLNTLICHEGFVRIKQTQIPLGGRSAHFITYCEK